MGKTYESIEPRIEEFIRRQPLSWRRRRSPARVW
jgi:hypothetical protein